MSVLSRRLDPEWRRKVDAALLEGSKRVEAPRSAAGDEDRLRAIPVVGRRCGGGAIPGTRPGVSRKLGSWSGR